MLRAVDVFVVTCGWEGLPRSVLEAMSAGVPVVATRVGGIPDVVSHGETGLLAAPGNISELAAHVASLLNDPGLAQRLAAAAGQEHRLQQFDNAASVDQYAGLYREQSALKAADWTPELRSLIERNYADEKRHLAWIKQASREKFWEAESGAERQL